MDPSAFEDAGSARARYRRRAGSQDAVTLPGDKGLPSSGASPLEWERYHAKHIGNGGFDPIAAMKGGKT
jgi:hypothetical protein